MRDALTQPPGRREPRVLFLSALAFVSGVGIAVGGPAPQSMDAAMPAPFVFTWGALLALSSAAMIVSAFLRDEIDAALTEMAGCASIAPLALAYGTAALAFAGPSALFPAGITAAYGAACGWRAWQVHRRLTYLRQVMWHLGPIR